MPWAEPALQTLRDRFRTDFIGRTDTGDAVLRRSVENVYSYVVPALTKGLYGYISWGIKQLIPNENSDLDSILKWSTRFLTEPQKAASQATGSVTFTGTNLASIPQGTTVTNRDGISFTTDAPYAISGTSVTGSVTAVVAGLSGNTEEGVAVFLGEPLAGIDDQAVVASGGITGGADEEDKSGVLSRLTQRLQTPPRGGSAGDYVAWATEVAAVSRAYEFPHEPVPGWVTVVIVDDVSGPVPGGATIAAAQLNIDTKRSIAMGGVVVRGPEPQQLDLTWSGLIPAPGDSVAQAKIKLEANVEAWVLSQAPEAILSQPAIEDAAQAVVTSVSLSSPTADPDPGQYGMYTTFLHAYT